MKFDELLSFGFDKYGEADFRVNCGIADLDANKMNQLRAMIPVGIHELEKLWFALGPPSKAENGCAGVTAQEPAEHTPPT